jgi:ketosteroid isomerase-like protein
LGEDRANAELRGDTRFLRQLLAENFVGVGPRGFTLTKEQWLDRLASGDLTYESLTWGEVQVRVYGDAGLAIGRETSKAKYRGQDIQGQFRETQIYVRQDGRWLLAGLQLSPIAEPS